MILASDSFNRADENPIASPWTSAGSFKILTNVVLPTNAAQDSAAYYTGVVWPNDQYSKAKITTLAIGTGGNGAGVLARQHSTIGTKTRYRVAMTTDHAELCKEVAGATTVLWNRATTFVSGNPIQLNVIGSTLRVFNNGSQIGADATDSAITSGNSGLFYSSTDATASIDDWEGGNFGIPMLPLLHVGKLMRHFLLPLLLLLAFLRLDGAIVRVGKIKATPTTSAGTSISKAYTPTTGNAVFVMLSVYKSGGDSGSLTVTCSDGGTNTYTQDATILSTGNANSRAYIFRNFSVTGGAFTYSCSWVGNRYSTMEVVEYSGLTGVADGTGTNAGTGNSPASSAIVTTNATDLILGECGLNNTPNGTDWSYDNGFVVLDESDQCSTASCSASMELIASTAGSKTAQITYLAGGTGTAGWACVSAAYKGTNPASTATGGMLLLKVGAQ